MRFNNLLKLMAFGPCLVSWDAYSTPEQKLINGMESSDSGHQMASVSADFSSVRASSVSLPEGSSLNAGTDYSSLSKDELLKKLLQFEEERRIKESKYVEMFTEQLQNVNDQLEMLQQRNRQMKADSEEEKTRNEEQKQRIEELERDLLAARRDQALVIEQRRHNEEMERQARQQSEAFSAIAAAQSAAEAREARKVKIKSEITSLQRDRRAYNPYSNAIDAGRVRIINERIARLQAELASL